MQSVKEYDLASWRRKFQGTYAYFPKKGWKYITNIVENDKLVFYLGEDGSEATTDLPVYKLPKTGHYVYNNYLLFVQHNMKAGIFKIGLSTDTFFVRVYSETSKKFTPFHNLSLDEVLNGMTKVYGWGDWIVRNGILFYRDFPIKGKVEAVPFRQIPKPALALLEE